MMCDEKNYIFFFLFCKKNVPLRYYKEPKINSMIPNFQYPTPIDREVNWDKSKTIMSRTDTAGVIDYVNQVFCDVCGYSAEELLGSPHNIIRHPDMPRVIFKVLWDNIQQGINFHAVAKNLAKSGEYYWVVTSRMPKGRLLATWHAAPLYLLKVWKSISLPSMPKCYK